MKAKTKNLSIRQGSLSFVLSLFLGIPLFGQNVVFDAVSRATSDVAEIRKRAEEGDAVAQVRFGDILTTHMRHADALQWYLKAAMQGNDAGEFHVGRTLLNGARGNPSDQNVQADPVQGLRWTFMSATNHNRDACWDMSNALQKGLGTDVDLVAAYAWLELSVEIGMRGIGSRVELNELAIKMSTAQVERAEMLAARFRVGLWEYPITRIIADGDGRLKLNGITISASQSLALINGQAVAEGETISVKLKPRFLDVKCIKIGKDSVTISIARENQPRTLRLKE
jgi:TPR repeat protein